MAVFTGAAGGRIMPRRDEGSAGDDGALLMKRGVGRGKFSERVGCIGIDPRRGRERRGGGDHKMRTTVKLQHRSWQHNRDQDDDDDGTIVLSGTRRSACAS
eukprot:764916-Hanusia_phi.AAC.4